MSEFVDAYTADGRKHRVPAHYLDHPRLGKGLRKTPPKSSAAPKQATKPAPAPPAGDDTKKGK